MNRFKNPGCWIWARLLLAALVLSATHAFAQEQRMNEVLKQLEQVRSFSGITISPDGKWVTWIEAARDNPANSAMFLLEWRNSPAQPRRISAAEGTNSYREGGIAWSPDSSQIAFLSDAGSADGQKQVFVIPAAGGKAKQVTNLNGFITDLRWSRDGKELAFLYAEHGGGEGPLEAVPAQVGVIGSEIHNQRVAVANLADGSLRQVSPGDLNIYEYDWSPDGSRFAAIAAPGPANNNWWTAQLYSLNAASGEMKLLYHPPVERQIAVPKWSPNGEQIGFIGGLMSDEGFIGGDIFLIPAAGGEPRDMTAGRKSSPSGFIWHGPNHLVFTEAVDGGGAISTLDVATDQTETLWRGEEDLHQDGNFPNLSFASDGRTSAVVRANWEQPPEVWAGPVGNWQQLTHVNASQHPRWGKAESLSWTNEGFRVQGWLLYPENFDPAKRYPMVVEIHGGPAGERAASWPSAHFDMSVMASLGYFVFFPNPRGSYGEGEAFTRANVEDFGYGDLRDILAGVDTVIKKVPVDNDRVGVTGWSYGGFMTMWTVTQTHRFRAAVAGAGISDWLSYYGENSIDEWMIPYFGASVYADPSVYAKSSPIHYIKNVRTPTLVIVGERDGECPAPQSFEFWHALETFHVPTELVVYAGEGHSFAAPKDRVDVMRRTLAWFDKYLSAATASKTAGR